MIKSHYKVSRKHSIPKSTLYDGISGKVKHADKPGPNQLYQVTGLSMLLYKYVGWCLSRKIKCYPQCLYKVCFPGHYLTILPID